MDKRIIFYLLNEIDKSPNQILRDDAILSGKTLGLDGEIRKYFNYMEGQGWLNNDKIMGGGVGISRITPSGIDHLEELRNDPEANIDEIAGNMNRQLKVLNWIQSGSNFQNKIKNKIDEIEIENTIKFLESMKAIVEVASSDSYLSAEFKISDIGQVYHADIKNRLPQSAPVGKSASVLRSKDIFIVHGRNNEMKLAVKDFVNSIGYNPIILHEQANKGRTIIEKFEEESGGARFAFVILSGDDYGYLGEENDESKPEKRVRQNVLLEWGFFIGKLGRENVYGLLEDGVILPSDMAGWLYEKYDGASGVWRYKAADEMIAVGYEVDKNQING